MSSNASSLPQPTAVSSLASSSLRDPLLQSEWMAAAWSRDIAPGQAIARRILGIDLVLWRSSEGLHCWRDLCIHRGARLSLGTVQLASRTTRDLRP